MSERTYYVTVYETDRAYGGPEEGGWWFDFGQPLDHGCNRAYRSLAAAQRYADKARPIVAQENADDRRHPPSSVLCDGWLEIVIEDAIPRPYPQERPRYE